MFVNINGTRYNTELINKYKPMTCPLQLGSQMVERPAIYLESNGRVEHIMFDTSKVRDNAITRLDEATDIS